MIRAVALVATGLVMGAWVAVCVYAVWPQPDEICTHEDDLDPSA